MHFLFKDLPLCTVPGKTMLSVLTDVIKRRAQAGCRAQGAFNSHEIDKDTATLYNKLRTSCCTPLKVNSEGACAVRARLGDMTWQTCSCQLWAFRWLQIYGRENGKSNNRNEHLKWWWCCWCCCCCWRWWWWVQEQGEAQRPILSAAASVQHPPTTPPPCPLMSSFVPGVPNKSMHVTLWPPPPRLDHRAAGTQGPAATELWSSPEGKTAAVKEQLRRFFLPVPCFPRSPKWGWFIAQHTQHAHTHKERERVRGCTGVNR